MKKAVSSGGIILKLIDNKLHILLIIHEDGFLVFPKGHIHAGESEETAAIREIQEETGLHNPKIIKKLGIVVRLSIEDTGERVMKKIHLFLMKVDNYNHKKAEEKCGWFTYEEAMEKLGFVQEKEFLKKIWSQIKKK